MNVTKSLLAALAVTILLVGAARSEPIEKRQVTLGVGGKAALYYLPLTICERLGYFKQQGLDVAINDFRGGAQSLQALVGGSVDVVTGAYEHTIRMQAKGQDIRAVIELGRFPGIALGVRKDRAASYKSAADLKGFKIGVTAPGSSTNFFVMYLMAKAGLKPTDVSYIGVGAGASAVAAMKKGEIDGLVNIDPMITKLEQDGDIKVVADSRTEAGTRAIFGGSNPAAVLYLKHEFAERNPNTVQALVDAFYKTLQWLDKATPEQIAATVPEEYFLGDKSLYLAALKANRQVYSKTGIIPKAGMQSAADMLVAFDDELKGAALDLPRTFDDRFVRKAAAGIP
ncbi:MAG TPA: ABC transporter substrate-binding protein [Xanthobacteraceae bacterium]|jgi:NitT/TauT family transport system substrate-binding protein